MKVDCQWGEAGAARPADIAIIVDVLSFSTSVSIAIDRGAMIFPWPDHDEDAATAAAGLGAMVAKRRGEGGFSLSPPSLRAIEPGAALVLPSPNGARCSLAAKAPDVLCGAPCATPRPWRTPPGRQALPFCSCPRANGGRMARYGSRLRI